MNRLLRNCAFSFSFSEQIFKTFCNGFIHNPKVYLYFRKVNRSCQDNYNQYIMYKTYLFYNAMYDKIYCTI